VLEKYAGKTVPLLFVFNAMSTAMTLIGKREKIVRTSLGKM
jgi:hypothetical protein